MGSERMEMKPTGEGEPNVAVPGTSSVENVIIAQITDTHICASANALGPEYWIENGRRLDTAIRSLNAETEPPHVVIGTGDLVEDGSPASYELLKQHLESLQSTFWPLPGNHDSPVHLRAAFPAMAWAEGHCSWAQSIPGSAVTIIALDTTQPGRAGGFVNAQRLNWLADQIDNATAAGHASILAMHHPPFLTGIDWMDSLGFEGMDQVATTVTKHRPSRIIAGHYHRPVLSQVGGVSTSVGIATAPHVHLDLSESAVPAIVNDPIGYQLHVVPVDSPVVISHTRYVDRATAAHPISLAV